MHKPRGLTFPELLVVIALMGILAALALPSFKGLIQSNTIDSSVRIFMTDLRFARSESIRRGGGVVMCRSDSPELGTATCGTGSSKGWESGWIIFHDLNNSGTKTGVETMLRVQAPTTSIDSIAEAGAATKFRFTASGRLNLSTATSIQFGGGSFDNEVQRVICVNVGGRARIAGNGTTACSTDQ